MKLGTAMLAAILSAATMSVSAKRDPSPFRFFPVRASQSSTPDQDYALYPKTLSATGLFSDIAAKTPAPGAFAYTVNSPLWSDGAYALRSLILPGDSVVTYVNDSDDFIFPGGAVLVKHLAMDTVAGEPDTRKYIETQLMVHQHGQWHGFSYRWRDDQTDADLAGGPGGTFALDSFTVRTAAGTVRKKKWFIPARTFSDYRSGRPGNVSCNSCHANYSPDGAEVYTGSDRSPDKVGIVLGFRMPQLSGARGGHDQIQDLLDRGFMVLGPGAAYHPGDAHRWVALEEPASLEKRARSYLAANCSHCHRAMGGNTTTRIDFRYGNPAAPMDYVGLRTYGAWSLRHPDGSAVKVIEPGWPEYSVLFRRISAADSSGYRDTTDYWEKGELFRNPLPLAKTSGFPGNFLVQMPPLSTYETNPLADSVIGAWIRSMAPERAVTSVKREPAPQHPARLQASRGLVRLPEGFVDAASASLVDVKGKRIRLSRIGSGVFALPSGLESGVYGLSAGNRHFVLAHFAAR